ncbi:ribosome hibernation-promoting factor, HPF/YfiA family [Brevibacillus sedimenti]|jgi:putative sigma-54 modulation protein|uniref:ribosome hibernation-promoting factor, HPF/YfiA family n=1 Tax=Brevibacillus sedimenti TaxID=2613334 RepID=UPI000E3882E4|nr:ribosome-associated translation inhibitor RaiA [Anoxybacillus sediminis]REK61033.1 MAG: ribosome-associated translation inhibitor RaiA [Brevibacillus sp.]UFJ61934.1 ribosome-associated translation inhibitor RaiA [Anoxybacillus sediminis]
MKFNIRGENMEVTAALREYVVKKVGRLEKYFETLQPAEAQVTLRVLRNEATIEVTIPLGGVIIRAEETHEDMYAAIDLVAEKLERQIRKHKTKLMRKLRVDTNNKALLRDNESIAVLTEDEEDDVEIDIVRTKRFDLKPMDAYEAVLQMDMLGHNFFVFQNSETNNVNVVYRRNDGRYGLIEPK